MQPEIGTAFFSLFLFSLLDSVRYMAYTRNYDRLLPLLSPTTPVAIFHAIPCRTRQSFGCHFEGKFEPWKRASINQRNKTKLTVAYRLFFSFHLFIYLEYSTNVSACRLLARCISQLYWRVVFFYILYFQFPKYIQYFSPNELKTKRKRGIWRSTRSTN